MRGRTFGNAGEEGEVGFQRGPGEGAAETDAEGGGGGYDEGELGEGRGQRAGRGGHGGVWSNLGGETRCSFDMYVEKLTADFLNL